MSVADLIQVEEALRQSEERYRDLFENAPLCIFEEDFSRAPPLIVRVNRRVRETYGWTEEEFRSLPVERVIPPQAKADYEAVTQAIRAGGSITLQSFNLRRDGSVFPIRLHATASRVAGEARAIVMTEDLSRQKKVQDDLAATRQRLQDIIDISFDTIFQMDLRGNYTFANRAAEKLTGYPLDRLLRMNMRELIAPDCLPRVQARLRQRAAEQEVRQPLSFAIIHRDGHRVEVELTTTGVYRERRLVGVQGIARDITERKRSQEALRESEMKYRLLFDAAPVGIGLADVSGKPIAVNPVTETITGYAQAELMRMNVASLYANPLDRRAMLAALERSGSIREWPVRLRRKDGKPCFVLLNVQRVRLDKRQLLLTCLRDITECRQLQQEVLEIAGQEKRRIGQDLHDSLGQNLTGVAFLAKVLAKELASASLQQAAQADRIAQLASQAIGQVRGLARGLCPVELRAEGLMTALGDLAANTEKVFGVTCRFQCDSRVPMEDENVAIHLYYIALEAVSNAVKHARARTITIGLWADGSRASLTVRDDGQGLPPDFQQGEGMGVRIMKYRAGVLGAALAIGPAEGNGTLVECSVELPAK